MKNPHTKECPVCGKMYQSPPSRDRQYCSWACHKIAIRKARERICLVCGTAFDPHGSESKFCSQACAHHSQKRQIELICKECGKAFSVKRTHRYQKFCTARCREQFNAAQPEKRETRVCLGCGKDFECYINRSTRYCSRKCALSAPKDGIVTLTCQECGSPYQVSRFFATKRSSRWCSRECMGAGMSKLKRGALNPNYRGVTVRYRGANWRHQSHLARIRDGNRCQVCHKKIGRKPHDYGVHHIGPYREFNGDWEKANDLSNLVTLCTSCHTKVEIGGLACPRPLL